MILSYIDSDLIIFHNQNKELRGEHSRVHGEAGIVGGRDAICLLVKLEHFAGIPAIRLTETEEPYGKCVPMSNQVRVCERSSNQVSIQPFLADEAL